MMYPLLICALSLPQLAQDPAQPLRWGQHCTIRFADKSTAAELLANKDLFLNSLSQFDLQCRLQQTEAVSLEQLQQFLKEQTLDFTAEELARLSKLLKSAESRLAKFKLPLPQVLTIIKTTGKDESGAAYCRGPAIVLPQSMLQMPEPRLERLLIHELFHVISNQNADLRRELYAIIGFKPCSPIVLPEQVEAWRITNPDGPTRDYYINLELDGKTVKAVPLTIARRDYQGGGLFQYLQFQLGVVAEDDGRWILEQREGKPLLLDPQTTDSYHKQIGTNTKYIIHPDEILADNFVHLAMGTKSLPNPEIVQAMAAKLANENKE